MIIRRALISTVPLIALGFAHVLAQDSVDVTFRYVAPGRTGVAVPGEFNGWSPAQAPMTNTGGDVWERTVRLRVGGNPSPPANGVPGAWQYKFWYNGVTTWPNDPLNHHQNPADNNNSFVYVKDPTIYQLVPNQRSGIVATATPVISAYIFPKVGSLVDSAAIELLLDGASVVGAGTLYNPATKQLVYTPPGPLRNGDHTVILRAGGTADTVSFTTRSGFLQITTRGGFSTVNPVRTLRGLVQDTTVTLVRLIRNTIDTTDVTVAGGRWSASDTLAEGVNTFRAGADSAGTFVLSDPVSITYTVSHAPVARASATRAGENVVLSAAGTTDPDGQAVSQFTWLDDPLAPIGLAGQTGVTATVPLPDDPGEYSFGLIAADPDGNADTIRSSFLVTDEGEVQMPTIAMNPEWARRARVYFLFPKAASPAGTLEAAAQRLPAIRDMGFSVVWLMPIMRNAFPINTGIGPGYNIVDFAAVAPEYGTAEDFRQFMQQAHALGLKVILDITPNHSSRSHPWAVDARTYGEDSPFWSWYEHAIIPHNTNGLGQSFDPYGFTYYSGFSDQLLNLNWKDPDLRDEMIRILKFWIKEYGVDGYRFDVYWGPHRRYGEAFMGQPVREALKRIKPDILLLAEDDGTGGGTETIYADYVTQGVRGGVDAAYDFKLYFNQLRGFGFSAAAITSLHAEIDNGGFVPGENALFMRFLESQDEDRIVYFYSGAFALDALTTFRRTMPMATVIFTAPGFPMLWNGQEVGWGYGIGGSKEARARSVIDWNYQGRHILAPHYQKLATLRGAFPAFTQPKRDTNADGRVDASDVPIFVRLASSNTLLYAFLRPFLNQNGVTVVNVADGEQSSTLDLRAGNQILFDDEIKSGDTVYVNELLTGETRIFSYAGLSAVPVTLPAYGSAVYTVSRTRDTLTITNPVLTVEDPGGQPGAVALHQNYPNPFNPATTIIAELPRPARVTLTVFDVLGRPVADLFDGNHPAGVFRTVWAARGGSGLPCASGVYFYRLTVDEGASRTVVVRSMLLIR